MNYELSLLLFAAARGARVQYMIHGDWYEASKMVLMKIGFDDSWRVHPKDEHLLWGPVSGEYWEMVMYEPDSTLDDGTMSAYLWHSLCMDDWVLFKNMSDTDKRTYLMLLACALQGEGL